MTIKIENFTPETKKPMVLYDSVFLRGTVTTSSEISGNEGQNALDEQTFDNWKSSVVPAYISTTLGSSETVDCLCIAAHNLGTSGSTVTAQYSTDGVAWLDAATSTPTDNTGLMVIFPPVTAQYWRVEISGSAANIGILRLGYRLVFPSGLLGTGYIPTNLAKNIDIQGGPTMGGQFTGNRITRKGASTTIDLAFLDRSFVDDSMIDFINHYDEGRAFFWAGSPELFIADIAYAWRPQNGSEMHPRYVESGLYVDVSFNLGLFVDA